jgi:triacylglycerol esterase/lipase EstA (alpha/beta hydrolase family)
MTSGLRLGSRFIATALAALLLLLAAAGATAKPKAETTFKQNPILFVHGIEGSGAQFESQKMRFMSNGYPASWFDEIDYNSTRAVADKSEVHQQIDAAIAALKQRTGKSQVDVAAHSLGTSVMYEYLTDEAQGAQRRANVAHYINIDGQANNPGVPTLAVWAGRGTPGRNMEGAQNVTIPNQTHVQTCTSAESFVEYYKFLTGKPPAHDIVPQSGAIQVAGKTLHFPENRGAAGATVEIWPLDDTGHRTTVLPAAAVPVTDGAVGGGAWGPVTLQAGLHYEFAVVRDGFPTLHSYYEPFVRSDYTVRLLLSDPVQTYTGFRPGSMGAVNIRYKEFWGDQPGESDQLLVNGADVCAQEHGLCPITKQVNAFFTYDLNRNGQTDWTQDPVLGGLPFIQGADVFIPGETPAIGTTSFQLLSRGVGPLRTINTPDWEAINDGVVVQWNDFEKPAAK